MKRLPRTAERLPLLLVFFMLLHPARTRADVYQDWDAFDKQVRDRVLTPGEGRKRAVELHARLMEVMPRNLPPGSPVFPVRGYGRADIGGANGSSYLARGYDYYAGKDHKGHPAHDIFIRDRDFDSKDDATGKPVEVQAFREGVVVALSSGWDPRSDTRGGNYVWIFNPGQDSFYCYAHLSSVAVSLREVVKAGQVIGTVGRTGRNAYPRRSPTHLHFLRQDYDSGRMTPRDTYPDLLKSLGTR